jgi:hypothetical protein
MKSVLAAVAAIVAVCFVSPAGAHHAAEGMVADDIYMMISDNLIGTPHLDVDLATIGAGADTMAVITVTVPASEVDAVLVIVGALLEGEGTQISSPLEIRIYPEGGDGLVTLMIMESIGHGESQGL